MLPRRSPERHAAEAVRELAPWIERRRRAVARAALGGRPRAGHGAVSGRVAAARARARAHARAPPRRRAARPRRRPAAGARALVPAPGATEVAPRLDAATRARGLALHRADDPRPADALGVLLVDGRDVVQLAAAAGAAGDPRLRRRARGLPPRGDGPLAALLAAARVALAATGARTRRGCAATARRSRSEAAAPRSGSSPCSSVRNTRPVQATTAPSPLTSTPARPAGPLSSIRAATRSPARSGGRRSTLPRGATRGRAARRPRSPLERLAPLALDLRAAADRDLVAQRPPRAAARRAPSARSRSRRGG